jgi:hypothetical protein
MTPPSRARRAPLLALPLALLAAATLAACTQSFGSSANRAGATPKAMAACRMRADEVYEHQNRAEVYSADMLAGGQRDSPFAAAGTPGSPTAGLSGRYARETMLDDCLNGMAGSPGATPDAPPPAEGPALPTAQPHD